MYEGRSGARIADELKINAKKCSEREITVYSHSVDIRVWHSCLLLRNLSEVVEVIVSLVIYLLGNNIYLSIYYLCDVATNMLHSPYGQMTAIVANGLPLSAVT